MATLLERLNQEMADVIGTTQSSLVQISNGHRGVGAGTIWHPDGLIVTNAHVSAGRRRRGRVHGDALWVTLPDGSKYPARIVAQDNEHDLAALRIEAQNLPTIPLGDSRQLKTGQCVFAVGHPWGVIGAVTSGVVIGSGGEWPEMPQNGREWLVMSLHLRPGHSGGPVVDIDGRLVGINTLITGPDVGVAVPVHVAKAFLRQALSV